LYKNKALPLAAGQLVTTALFMTGYAAISNGLGTFGREIVEVFSNTQLIGGIAYTGLVTTAFAVWLETLALEYVPATEMSVIFTTEPLWGAWFSR
jgi:drug/metabolite transporter (DMT)-like permease